MSECLPLGSDSDCLGQSGGKGSDMGGIQASKNEDGTCLEAQEVGKRGKVFFPSSQLKSCPTLAVQILSDIPFSFPYSSRLGGDILAHRKDEKQSKKRKET